MVSLFWLCYDSDFLLTRYLGASSSIRRQKAEEEVVEREGYVNHPRMKPLNSPSESTLSITKLFKRLRLCGTNNISVKDKANHAVVLDKATSDKMNKDVQSYRLITVAVLVDRLKINGSLARKALNDLEDRGVIKKVVGHSRGCIYTRAAAGGD